MGKVVPFPRQMQAKVAPEVLAGLQAIAPQIYQTALRPGGEPTQC
jgi:hypothetical protein